MVLNKKKLFVLVFIFLILIITIIILVLLNNNSSEELVVKGFIVKNQSHVFSVDMTPEEYDSMVREQDCFDNCSGEPVCVDKCYSN